MVVVVVVVTVVPSAVSVLMPKESGDAAGNSERYEASAVEGDRDARGAKEEASDGTVVEEEVEAGAGVREGEDGDEEDEVEVEENEDDEDEDEEEEEAERKELEVADATRGLRCSLAGEAKSGRPDAAVNRVTSLRGEQVEGWSEPGGAVG